METKERSGNLKIRSSSAEFLIFSAQAGSDTIDVRYEDQTLWLTQKMIGTLFDVEANTITYHLKEVYDSGELEKSATARKFRVVQTEGNREVAREIEHYNLDAVISVGYRVNSLRATQFRRWAAQILRKFTVEGYVLDRVRMENGAFLNEDYFEKLLEEIREIRLSERRFYQKITDIYATSMDYDKHSPLTRQFFAKVQNKMHYAVSMQTAAKNYLSQDELEDLGRIVNAFLDLAESRAKRRIPMTMQDWAERIDKFLLADDRDILQNAGSISMKIAKDHAESEFEIYRVIQDRIFESDFDKLLLQSESKK